MYQQEINHDLFKYLIRKLNSQSLKYKTSKDKSLILSDTMKFFKDYLIENEDKELFTNKEVKLITEYQPIISNNKIAKCEVLTSFEVIDNKGGVDKETTDIVRSYKNDFLLFISDYCYDSTELDRNHLFKETDTNTPIVLKDKLKVLMTNALFINNINDSLKSLDNIENIEIENIKADKDTIITLNIGKNELNSGFLSSLIYSLKKSDKEIIKRFKESFQIEILEHSFDLLDKKILNKSEIKKVKREWQNILNICNKYGLKLHIDDFNGNQMYNRVVNLTNIFEDNLKSIKLDKKLILSFNVFSVLKDIDNETDEIDKKIKFDNLIEIITPPVENNHFLIKFFKENNLDITSETDFYDNKEKIYKILNQNTIEIVKIHFFNTYQVKDIDKFIDNNLFNEIINKNELIDYTDINNILKKEFGENIRNNQKELTCEYIETGEVVKELEKLQKIYGHTLNFQGYYFSGNIRIDKTNNLSVKFKSINNNSKDINFGS